MFEKTKTVAFLLRCGAEKIQSTLPLCKTAALDASLLLSHVLGKNRADLILNRTDVVDSGFWEQYRELIERRCLGEPVAYLVGKKAFWMYDFFITPDVLIPKPDTELLVEKALEIIDVKLKTGKKIVAADICTGSGCVAVSLLARFNKMHSPSSLICLAASDISPGALAVAEKNAAALLTAETRSCLRFALGDLLEAPGIVLSDSALNLIVSNPPYVPSRVARELLTDGRKEPLLALDGGKDGLDLIRRLALQSFVALETGGVLLMETGEYNAEETRAILCRTGFSGVLTFNDLAGLPRVTQGVK